MNHFFRAFLVVCLLGAVVSAATVAPVMAQEGNETNGTVTEDSVMPSVSPSVPAQDDGSAPPNESNGSEGSPGAGAGAGGGPASGNTSAGAGGNGSGGPGASGGPIDGAVGAVQGAVGSATPDIPSPEEIANSTAQWAVGEAGAATRAMLNVSLEFLVGTPAPENAGAHGIFGEPTNEPYASLYENVYGPITFQYSIIILMILLFMWSGLFPWAGVISGGDYTIMKLIWSTLAALAIVIFWWPFGTFLATAFDVMARTIAPSPQELTDSVGDAIRLSLGPVLGILALNLVGMVEVLALLLIYGLRYGAIIVGQVFMPFVLVFAYAAPHRRLRSAASTIAWQYFGLLAMVLPTACFMRIGDAVEWGFGLGGIANGVISLSLFLLAIVSPAVTSFSLFKSPPSISSISAGAAGGAVAAGSAARQRFGTNQLRDDSESGGGGTGGSRIETTRERVRERVSHARSRLNDGVSRARDVAPSRPGSSSTSGTATDGGGSDSSAAEVRELARKRREGTGPTAAKARWMNNGGNDDNGD